MRATKTNTAFITVDTYNDEHKTGVFRWSAEMFRIPVIYCDKNTPWKGSFHHKIELMYPRLLELKRSGIEFVFVLDCRDVVFINPIEVILEKLNSINTGKAIFNKDIPGVALHSRCHVLTEDMKNAMGSKYANLNAGAIASHIDTLLTIQEHAKRLRNEFLAGTKQYGNTNRKLCEHDQHIYQVCLVHYPHLFQIDYDKKLFALLFRFPDHLNGCSSDPHKMSVINEAGIIHAPLPARTEKWHGWVKEVIKK